MKLCKLMLSLAVLTAASAAASAQMSVYGLFTGSRLSSIPYTGTHSATTNGSFSSFGGAGGIFYDFHTLGPVRLGVDARGSVTSSKKGVQPNFIGGGGHLNSGLLGLRGSFHTPFKMLQPYVQASAGIARTDFGKNYGQGITYSNNLQFEGFAGLDLKILPFMDLRVLEYGAGAVHGTGSNSGTYPLQTVSTGIVFHLPF